MTFQIIAENAGGDSAPASSNPQCIAESARSVRGARLTSSIRAMRRSFEAVSEQAEGQLADARAKAELAKRELDRALTLNQTQAVADAIVDQRRQTLQAAHAAVKRVGR